MGGVGATCHSKCGDGDGSKDSMGEEPVLQVDDTAKASMEQKERDEEVKRKLTVCAKNLRTRSAKESAECWKKVEDELKIQRLIWQSLGLQRGAKHQGAAAMVESKLDFAIAQHKANIASSLEAIDTCFEKNKGFDLIGQTMETSMKAVKAAHEHSEARKELASILDKVAEEFGKGVKSAKDVDIQSMLDACFLEDKKFEASIKAVWKVAAP
eukprot:TRINITY_DN12586_c0_g1_i4.p1 TRINITY_DN12586_c0_g1~~TRINITY_DN12586_c0_g1_i4.p1  ORF type:complete len:212 (+),score=63.30 TRINITY_DN12586_c0_g1_i4:156-791(+)